MLNRLNSEHHGEIQCTCEKLPLEGDIPFDGHNWDPDCPSHGMDSSWWNSSKTSVKRTARAIHLNEIQNMNRLARLTRIPHNHRYQPGNVRPRGECPLCNAYVDEQFAPQEDESWVQIEWPERATWRGNTWETGP